MSALSASEKCDGRFFTIIERQQRWIVDGRSNAYLKPARRIFHPSWYDFRGLAMRQFVLHNCGE
jgi:hypothetical protein